jgi:hypothetical protein
MRAALHLAVVCALASLAIGCAATGMRPDGDGGGYREPDTVNFRFIGRDTGIDNPEGDRRSYYRVFIDKAEEGRTTTGLESQEKVYEGFLQPNRHLITVEKWVLDEKAGRYVKLNNIEQPKPNYFYFDMPERRMVIVRLKAAKDGTAGFDVELERK